MNYPLKRVLHRTLQPSIIINLVMRQIMMLVMRKTVLIIVRVIFQNPTNSRKFEMGIMEEITRIFVQNHGEETK
jgi:hypothetical protein